MNREETKQAIEVMQAYVDGAEIEFQLSDESWCPASTPNWDHDTTEYRIKPSPREFWIADVEDEFRKVLCSGQIDLSADHQYIKVREVLE